MNLDAYHTDIQKRIIASIKEANNQICIAVAWFTNKSLMAVLEEKLLNQQRIELIILNDALNFRSGGIAFQNFIDKGGKLYISHKDKKLHHKFCLVDHNLVLTGSYNWTYCAENNNFENVVVSNDHNLVASYEMEFDKVKRSCEAIENLNRFHALYPPLSGSALIAEYMNEDMSAQLENNDLEPEEAFEILGELQVQSGFRNQAMTILENARPELKVVIVDKKDAIRLLMARFYNWDVGELEKYANNLNIESLVVNTNILWTAKKMGILGLNAVQRQTIFKNGRFDDIDWYLHENQEEIDWEAISQNSVINWPEETLERFKHRIKWGWFNYKSAFKWSADTLEKFGASFENWNNISAIGKIDWTIELIEKFEDKWNWDLLSQNNNLPWSNELFRKFLPRWNLRRLSANHAFKWTRQLFEEFETRWDLHELQTNPGMCWDEDLIRRYVQRLDPMKILRNPCIYWSAQMIQNMYSYLDQYVLGNFKGWTYISCANGSWMSENTLSRFEDKITWNNICDRTGINWTPSFIERFKRRLFVYYQSNIGGISGLCENNSFPWSIALVREAQGAMSHTYGTAWRNLCGNSTFEISEEFIHEFEENINFGALSGNRNFKITEGLLDRYIDKSWYWRVISQRTDFNWTDKVLNKYTQLDWTEISQNQKVYELVVKPVLNPMMMKLMMNDD